MFYFLKRNTTLKTMWPISDVFPDFRYIREKSLYVCSYVHKGIYRAFLHTPKSISVLLSSERDEV